MNDDDEPFIDPEDEQPEEAPRRKRKTKRDIEIEKRQDERAQWWREALSTQVGRRCLYEILSVGGCFEDRLGVGPTGFPDPHATFLKLGEKGIVQRLYQDWQAIDYQGVYAMLVENDHRYAKAQYPTVKKNA